MTRLSNKLWFSASLICIFTAGTVASAAGVTFTRNLTVGIRGDDVSALQQLLIVGGFLKIPAVTGYFGLLTRDALGAWQAAHGVSPAAGYFGAISRAKIATVGSTASSGNATTTATTAGATNIAIANKGNGLPVRLVIPKINVNAGFQYMGLAADGSIDSPTNVTDVGWFTGSARPGENGSAIVTGHVARIQGGILTKQGVFSGLRDLRPGDLLYVINDKGESVTFAVRESRVYDPKSDAPDVFKTGDGIAHLNLITCEGFWDPSNLHYTQTLVVFADAVR